MRLLLPILVAAWFAASGASPAHADPISAVVGIVVSALSGSLTIGTIATTVLGLGLSFGIQTLMSALTPKPKKSTSTGLQGASFGIQAAGDIPRQGALGTVATAGQIIHASVYGDDREYLQLVFALFDNTCIDLADHVYVNNERLDLVDLDKPEGATCDKFYGVETYAPNEDFRAIAIRFYRGTMGQEADPELVDHAEYESGDSGPKLWSDAHRGAGVCYVSVTVRYDPEVFPGGRPSFLWVVKGAAYDPRHDSTVPGGSGPQRWGNPNTWGYSENPAILAYNWYRGFYRGDTRVLGMGVPAYDLLTETFISAANICDETEDGTKRYVASLVASEDDQWGDVVESLVEAMAGQVYERVGLFSVKAGAAELSVATLSDDDLVVGAPVEFSAKRPRSELANYVLGSYLEPRQAWAANAYKPVTDETWIAADAGERIEWSLDLMSVPVRKQARRVAIIRAEEMRQQARTTRTVGFRHLTIEAGDWITWPIRGINRWRVESRQLNPDLTVTLGLRQIHPSVYNGVIDDEPDVTIINPRLPTLPSTVSNFTVQAGVIERESPRQKLPALIFGWDPITDRKVQEVIIEYRRFDEPDDVYRVVDPKPESGRHKAARGILAGQDYEARATITTRPPRYTTWTPWVSAGTGADFWVPEADYAKNLYDGAVDIEALNEQIQGFLRDGQRLLDYLSDIQRAPEIPGWPAGFGTRDDARSLFPFLNVRDILDRATENSLVSVLEAYSDETASRQAQATAARTLSVAITEQGDAFAQEIFQLGARTDDAEAQIVEISTVQTSDRVANAVQFTALTARVGENSAQILQTSTALSTLESSFASQLLEIVTTFNGNVATLNSELSALSNAHQTTANALLTLNSAFGTFQGTASTQLTTLANNDLALAASISTLTATNAKNVIVQNNQPGASGRVVGDIWIRPNDLAKFAWNGSSWVSIDDSWVAANASVVQQQAIARVTSDEALAGQINSVTASVGVQTGRIDQLANVRVARLENGQTVLDAKWGVNITANGAPNGAAFILGLAKNGDNTLRTAIFKVDDFWIWNGTSAVKPFLVRDGNVYIGGDLIVRGSIAGTALVASTITTRELAVDAVKANNIDADAVRTEHLRAGAVTTDVIAANAASEFINIGSAVNDDLPKSGAEVVVCRSPVITAVSGGVVTAWFNAKIVNQYTNALDTTRLVEVFFRFVRVRADNGASTEIKSLRIQASPYGAWAAPVFMDRSPLTVPCRYEVRASLESAYSPADRGSCKLNHTQMVIASIKR